VCKLGAMEILAKAQASEIKRIIQAGNLPGAIELHRQMYCLASNEYFHETDTSDLRACLTTPLPLFSFCSAAELLELRLRMATALVFGGRVSLVPDESFPWKHKMTTKAAIHNFFASIANYRTIADWRRSNVVLRAKIRNCMDGPCSSCREAAKEYELADLPSIPIHTCENINTIGCRCVAVASQMRGIDH
jgi:hypothetical protein